MPMVYLVGGYFFAWGVWELFHGHPWRCVGGVVCAFLFVGVFDGLLGA